MVKINPPCTYNLELETTSHYLLRCTLFQAERRFLVTDIKEIDEQIVTYLTLICNHGKNI